MMTSLRQKVIENTTYIKTTNVLLGELINRTETLETKQDVVDSPYVPSEPKTLLSVLIRTNLDGVIQGTSDGTEDILGKTEDELVGTNVSNLMTPDVSKIYTSLNSKSNSVSEEDAVIMGQDTKVKISHLPSQQILIFNVKEI
jgi:nitrogen fixation/metabolism regulation signal transduction histidine kinase